MSKLVIYFLEMFRLYKVILLRMLFNIIDELWFLIIEVVIFGYWIVVC